MDELIAETPESLCRQVLDSVGEDVVYAVNPNRRLLSALVSVASAQDIQLRIVARAEVASAALEDFIVASRVAELAGGVRTVDGLEDASTICTRSRTTVVLPALDDAVAGVPTTSDSIVESQYAEAEQLWNGGDMVERDVPSLTTLESSLAETFGEEVRDDFESVLERVTALRGDEETLSVYQVLILVGAVHQIQFAELVEWAEDIGLCSRASLSRAKHTLSEKSLVTTVKVRAGIGRPRQQLVLAEELQGNEFEELLSMAQNLLTKVSPVRA